MKIYKLLFIIIVLLSTQLRSEIFFGYNTIPWGGSLEDVKKVYPNIIFQSKASYGYSLETMVKSMGIKIWLIILVNID